MKLSRQKPTFGLNRTRISYILVEDLNMFIVLGDIIWLQKHCYEAHSVVM